MATFGDFIRRQREARRAGDAAFSVRQVAARVGIEPSYLSKIERGEQPPPSEQTIAAIARELDEDADVLLALAGKVSSDLRNMPDHAVLRVVREVRDGEW
jgi:transcriptional regulator with XRE-family HTH domain